MAKEGKNLVIIPEGTNTSNVATWLCSIDTNASPYQAATVTQYRYANLIFPYHNQQ